MKLLIFVVITIFHFTSAFSQWTAEMYRVTETPATYFTSNLSEDIFLEIYHDREENAASLNLNLNRRRDLYEKPATLFMYMINGTDTTTYESDEFVLTSDFHLSSDVMNMKFAKPFFNAQFVVVKIHTQDEIVTAKFKMTGILEIKRRLQNYIEFSNYSWKWDRYECIFEFGATMYNHSGMYADKVNVILIVTRGDDEVVYRKQHTLDVDFNNGDIGPVKITLAEPLCSISNVYEFDESYYVCIRTPEPKTSQLLINWK